MIKLQDFPVLLRCFCWLWNVLESSVEMSTTPEPFSVLLLKEMMEMLVVTAGGILHIKSSNSQAQVQQFQVQILNCSMYQ